MVEIKFFEDALRLHREIAERFERQIADARKGTTSAVEKMAVEGHEDAVERAKAALAAVEADRAEALRSFDERVERCKQELARANRQLESAKNFTADVGKSASSRPPASQLNRVDGAAAETTVDEDPVPPPEKPKRRRK